MKLTRIVRALGIFGGNASVAPSVADLGRFRHGDPVRFGFTPDYTPDDVPTYAVTDAAGAPVASGHAVPRPGKPGYYEAGPFSPAASTFPVGKFFLTVSFTTGGETSFVARSFSVIPGGDTAGSVVSIASLSRPGFSSLLAQTHTGRLFQADQPTADA